MARHAARPRPRLVAPWAYPKSELAGHRADQSPRPRHDASTNPLGRNKKRPARGDNPPVGGSPAVRSPTPPFPDRDRTTRTRSVCSGGQTRRRATVSEQPARSHRDRDPRAPGGDAGSDARARAVAGCARCAHRRRGEEAPRAVTSGARGATRGAPQSPTSSSRREREQAKDVRAPAKPRGERSRTAARPAGQGARSAGSPVRQRAPRGANRRAVLRVVGERPGVTAAELSVASGVHRGTLSALLRTLVGRGELEKRSLPAAAPATRPPPARLHTARLPLRQVRRRAQRAQQALDRQPMQPPRPTAEAETAK